MKARNKNRAFMFFRCCIIVYFPMYSLYQTRTLFIKSASYILR